MSEILYWKSLKIPVEQKRVLWKSVQWKPHFILKGKGIFFSPMCTVSMQFGKCSVQKSEKNFIHCLQIVWRLIQCNLYFTLESKRTLSTFADMYYSILGEIQSNKSAWNSDGHLLILWISETGDSTIIMCVTEIIYTCDQWKLMAFCK